MPRQPFSAGFYARARGLVVNGLFNPYVPKELRSISAARKQCQEMRAWRRALRLCFLLLTRLTRNEWNRNLWLSEMYDMLNGVQRESGVTFSTSSAFCRRHVLWHRPLWR